MNEVTHFFLCHHNRLNSGPLGEFSGDVGNRTSIRVSYPEGTPRQWVDHDPQPLFVAVVYKAVDLSWLSAMINKHTVVCTRVCTSVHLLNMMDGWIYYYHYI